MDPITLLKWVCAVLITAVGLSYSYQLVYLLLPLFRKDPTFPEAAPRRYAILIAARNEEAVLPHLLDSIARQNYPKEYITTYVVADNCTDRTAAVAAAAGARVFSRFNSHDVGKGFALHYLLQQIRLEGKLEDYDAFLIFDADNLLEPDYIAQMNKVCAAGYPAFCGYRNSKNFGSNWLAGASGLWYLHESTHLNRSRMALGVCCGVSGTGFGFTRQLLEEMGGWNFFTLTEDVEFRTWCAVSGIRIGYCYDAVLYDEQPTSMEQSWRQRTRWVQGGIQVSLRYAPDYWKGIRKGGWVSWSSFEALTWSLWGVCLSVFSLALRLLLIYETGSLSGLAAALLESLVWTWLSSLVMGGLTLAMEWKRIRADTRDKLLALLGFPIFMLSYVPISLTALFRKRHWQPIFHTVSISARQL